MIWFFLILHQLKKLLKLKNKKPSPYLSTKYFGGGRLKNGLLCRIFSILDPGVGCNSPYPFLIGISQQSFYEENYEKKGINGDNHPANYG